MKKKEEFQQKLWSCVWVGDGEGGMLALLCVKQSWGTVLQPWMWSCQTCLLCLGWKGPEFCSQVAVCRSGLLPKPGAASSLSEKWQQKPSGQSSPAFHLGNNNGEMGCDFFFATCGRTRCLTVPARNPTMALLVHGIPPSHGTPHGIPRQGNNLQHHFCCLLNWSLSCASVNMPKQILNITRSQAGGGSSPCTVAGCVSGSRQGRRCCGTVSFPCWVSKLSGDKAAVVAHPGCRMAASCLCLEHEFPNTTEFLWDDPKCCLCSRALQLC